MEQINIEETAQTFIAELEDILGKIAVSAEAGLSTYHLEPIAQKFAGKLQVLSVTLEGLSIYKDVKTSNEVYGSDFNKLPAHIFMAYAKLSKKCNDTSMDIFKDDDKYFVKFEDNVFINLDDLPHEELPTFKVKIEGNKIMAVRSDLFDKLPTSTQKLLGNKKRGG